jgi:ADP-heptose:LPS heptosyltransferase
MRSGSVKGLGDLRWDLVPYTRGEGVELGCGPVKAFPHFVGVRLSHDAERGDHPDYVCDDFDDLSFLKDDALNFVVATHGDSQYMPEIERVLKVGGYYCSVHDGALYRWVKVQGGSLVSLDGVADDPLHGSRTCLVIRYGAIGDTLQATSILPELKEQGFHVTWLCEPTGHEYLKLDPNIDAFIVNDKDQVPNAELPAYWAHLGKKFDRVINLCESVEGSLLKLPGRADFNWPQALRREMCNHNYLEFIAKMAGLPFHAEHRFYASEDEQQWAKDYIARIHAAVNRNTPTLERSKKPFVVMWALAGSSVHKFYPHQDAIIARLMLEIPECHVILVGDPACIILEAGWENESRVHRESGRIDVRHTMALAQRCDLVIGPETGVLNAVAFENSAKICLLSHSSPENLTKHWHNTYPLASPTTPCWPCHRMHYTREHCPEDAESGASRCMAELPADHVWAAVSDAYSGWTAVKRLMENV